MQELDNTQGSKRFDRIDLIPLAIALLLAFAAKAHAQDFAAQYRMDAAGSSISAPAAHNTGRDKAIEAQPRS
jgi:hypothetical protein